MRRYLLVLLLLTASANALAQSAGKVDKLLPAGFIARGPATSAAKQADPVQWNDILRTNDEGRMRIALDDGSMLSLGAHSELRVVKHDVQSNQTVIEMLYGKARANVVPIRKNGGSFQVRTPTAVIGVLGTTLDVETVGTSTTITGEVVEQLPTTRRNIADLAQLTPGSMPRKNEPDNPTIADYLPVDGTLVRSLDHIVGVRSIDPEIIKTVILMPGQYTFVGRGMPPTDPKFGEPPEEYRPKTKTITSSDFAGGCPGYVDMRQFDRVFGNGPKPEYEITGMG